MRPPPLRQTRPVEQAAARRGGRARRVVRRHPVLAVSLLAVLAAVGVWLVKIVQLQARVEEHRESWSQPRGEPGGLVYVALGDSAAQGIGASRPERGYVGLLAERLRAATGRPVQVVNLSASGARIDDLLREQLPRLAGLDADVVTVAIGGNDVRAYDRQAFEEQVDRLVAALPAGTFVADVPYYMHGRWERRAQQAADAVTERARAAGLVPVPLHEALRDEGWSAMLDQFAADWFHPNDRGHRVWADAFWAEISRSDALR